MIDVRDAETKAQWLRQADEITTLLHLGGDLLIASALAPEKQRESLRDKWLSEFSLLLSTAEKGRAGKFTELGQKQSEEAFEKLRGEAEEILQGRRPFHWPLELPEVFGEGRGGFNAFVGNPPFQGGKKITGVLGTAYRDYLVEYLARGQRGNADLCAYFFLRASDNIRVDGGMGLLATNTLAQGDTREVGLDQILRDNYIITRAISSRKWPGEASLEVAAVWMHKGSWCGAYVLDERPVSGITTLLTTPSAIEGEPRSLLVNMGKSFQGSVVLSMGFTLEIAEAYALISKDSRNRDVLFPYINGEDLNSRPDQSPSRWVINFRDWSLGVADTYPDCMQIVREKVKPERDRLANGGPSAQGYAKRWWQHGRLATNLYDAIQSLQRVLVVAATSRTLAFAFSPQAQVFSNALYVFALENNSDFALLQSVMHEAWVRNYASSMKGDLRYTSTDVFENFPFPPNIRTLDTIGKHYHEHRRVIMLNHQEGLTKTYNRFHNPNEHAEDITKLRSLHVEMDQAVAAAYGWNDLDLGHGFHETKQGLRYTISEVARWEVLDRLLLLNHERYAEEEKQGLHSKAKGKGKKAKGEAEGQLGF